MSQQLKQLIKLSEIATIKSYWNTSHECERCDKSFCGAGAALVILKNGRDRIICSDCVNQWKIGSKSSN